LNVGSPAEISTSTWTTYPSRPITAQVWVLASMTAAPLAPARGKIEELSVVYGPVAELTLIEERKPALQADDSDRVAGA